jgi:hypothetical protein
MKCIFYSFAVLMVVSCNVQEKVLYEEFTPSEFSARLADCPVAYLPLGTLERHSFHLPLGSDGMAIVMGFRIEYHQDNQPV